jgi:hypothetical protein
MTTNRARARLKQFEVLHCESLVMCPALYKACAITHFNPHMRPSSFLALIASFWLCLGSASLLAGEATPAPDFKEVYDLIRTNLPGLTEEQLNRLSVDSLLSALAPKVALVGPGDKSEGSEGPLVSRPTLFDGDIGYVRIHRVTEGLDNAIRTALTQLATTNKLKGLVLDLRYCGGDDYAASAAVGDLFVRKERPLLNWGTGMVRSKEKPAPLASPVAVLINHQTAGAAEALAGILREAGAGLLFGSKTAGQAMITKEYPLKSGQQLRIAAAPIELGDGSVLSTQGTKPDIAVDVALQDEHAYYTDAFKLLARTNTGGPASLAATNLASGTNRNSRRVRFNEAELVRERREGMRRDSDAPSRNQSETDTPVVHDPALARALDMLKGLSLVRQSRAGE